MKNLANKEQVLNENRGENSLYDYVSAEAQSDPNFYRWLFDEEFENDFDSSLTTEQHNEFDSWLEEIRIDEVVEKYIAVSMNNTDEDKIRITKRANFEKMGMCDCYGNHGQKSDCYTAGCYSFDNSGCTIFDDFYAALSEEIGPFGTNMDELEITNSDLVDWLSDKEGSVAYNTGLEYFHEWVKMVAFFKAWKSQNETHTEVTGWTYHDSHNFKTVVLATDFGEPDCEELNEEETRAILAELPGVPHIEETNESVETENYRFSFDLWATNPWHCYVEKL